MALSLLISFATAVGASEGIKASMARSRREEHRSRKNNLILHCPKSSQFSPYLEGRQVVLSGDRLFVDTGTAHDIPFGHPFEGYYLPYPDSRFSGLVSTITHEAPIMNWIFVDPVTYQVRFGNRAIADGNVTGPWECTRQDRRLTFCGWEGFCAVLEDSGIWGLYFDCDGDSLRQKMKPEGRIVIEIELLRREMRTGKPEYHDPEREATDHEQLTPQPPRDAEKSPVYGHKDVEPEVKEDEQSSDMKFSNHDYGMFAYDLISEKNNVKV
ncbi:hypothetical protein CFIO01_12685 [Colletotrichum fioriniae PJ7]|uniref:Uncharacterized protein n=1 Tax=Colletotrichum fioriniae PJ7 TaxID=1445577 RepID=A0A010Q9Y1_9PEZI|nr:hypothetical protein CFIO01_12685 [Colletotrichum fioriniae PJ7]